MRLPEFCISRPVFTIVMSLVLMIVGVIGFQRLSVRRLPEINKPTLHIRTDYPGASAKLIETQLTTPIENAISSVSGIESMISSSQQGESRINVTFTEKTNINVALDDVRNKLSNLIKNLPTGAEAPEVFQADSNTSPALFIRFADKKMTPMEITDYLNRYVTPQFLQLNGVSSVFFFGERQYAMWIWLHPSEMAARGVTTTDILNALQAQNQNVPSGEVKSAERYYPIVTQSSLQTAEQFGNLVISNKNGYITRFKDIATVKIGPESTDNIIRDNGKPALVLGVVPKNEANPVTVSNEIHQTLKLIRKSLPTGMSASINYDSATYIKASINDVYQTLFEALLLVLLVIFLFLGNWRAALIPIVTIPICLISIFAGLYWLDYSINTLTLLALILAIGLVVDDAIVMLENIFRYIEQGMKPMEAAIKGSREIRFAIIAMTITLVAVYFPIGFMQGFTGILFRQFAFTLAGAVLISGFVALSLSPMMCSRLLKPMDSQGKYLEKLESISHKLIIVYRKLLTHCLKLRWGMILVVLLLGIGGYFIYHSLPSILAPKEDEGRVIVFANAPSNASFHYTDQYAKQIEKIYKKIKAKSGYLMAVGYPQVNQLFSIVVLKPWDKRTISQQQVAKKLAKEFKNLTGVTAFAVSPSPLGMHKKDNYGVTMQIMSSGTYKEIHDLMQNLIRAVKKYPGVTNVNDALKFDTSYFDISIKRNVAAELNVNVDDITNTISTMFGGSNITDFDYGGQSYEVIVQLPNQKLKDLRILNKINVRSQTGQMIPISNLITVKSLIGPEELPHYDRMRADKLYVNIAPGYSMGEVINFLAKTAKANLPSSAQFAFSGSAKNYLESKSAMNDAFILAFIFIYLVLAAQFESFKDPLVVLFSVPLCIIGALFTLKITHNSLNLYSNIGLVTLIGLVAKHGILITEFANQIRAQGKSAWDAVLEAAGLRLRPILMTTAAMVLGAVPLALSTGPGANARHQIGWVIVGGMLIGTFFSLFVVPSVYVLLASKNTK